MYTAALEDPNLAAACHWEAAHGDPHSPEAMAWSLLEAHARLSTIGLVQGLAKAGRRK